MHSNFSEALQLLTNSKVKMIRNSRKIVFYAYFNSTGKPRDLQNNAEKPEA